MKKRPSPLLLVHGGDPVAWAKRFGIEPLTHPCSECGASCTTTIPFVHGTRRGLASAPCACGNARTPYAYVCGVGDLLRP